MEQRQPGLTSELMRKVQFLEEKLAKNE